MWDDARALRKLSNTLLGISLLLVLCGAVYYVMHLPVFPLRAVQLSAAPQQVDPAQIEDVVRREVRGNFFTADLGSVQHALEKLPWVRKVSVRRQFPWKLEVEMEEHVALARWNDVDLVNTHGEVFVAESSQILPKFGGQPGSAAEVAQMYMTFGAQLAPLQHEIAQISLSPRRAWQLQLDNGMVLKLGREQAEERLALFVQAYPQSLAPLQRQVSYVDLRYRNGFAAYTQGGRV